MSAAIRSAPPCKSVRMGVFTSPTAARFIPAAAGRNYLANLKRYGPALKARLAPAAPFGLGLRLSAAEADELLAGDRLAEFQDFLATHDLYVFTLNGFPYGDLTGPSAKPEFLPPTGGRNPGCATPWTSLRFSAACCQPGSKAPSPPHRCLTRPGSPPAMPQPGTQMTRNLVRVTASLAQIKAATGQLIHLDLEPEPDGLLSASREVADFFRDWLLQTGAPVLAEQSGISGWEAHQCLLEHIRVCLDTCHLAVEYEDPAAALNTLAAAGIRVGKVQITAGLKVELPAAAGLREAVVRDLETLHPFPLPPPGHRPDR